MTEHTKPVDPTADNPGGADAEPARKPIKRAVRPKHAASLLVWREGADGPELLMGLRHAQHRFMPSVLVFPGGGVDRGDSRARAVSELPPFTRASLERKATPSLARGLGVAAARELFEETGLVLGERRGEGIAPDLGALEYLCRAVTPATRPIRFNARFLVAQASAVHGDFAGSGELESLGWYTAARAVSQKLAPITSMIIREFTEWHAMDRAAREARTLIVFRGLDNRMTETP